MALGSAFGYYSYGAGTGDRKEKPCAVPANSYSRITCAIPNDKNFELIV